MLTLVIFSVAHMFKHIYKVLMLTFSLVPLFFVAKHWLSILPADYFVL